MNLPIDLTRYDLALSDLESALAQRDVDHEWLRTLYAGARAVYELMTPEQQAQVEARLERVRLRVQALRH